MPLSSEDAAKRQRRIATFCREGTVDEATWEFGLSRATILRACRAHGITPQDTLSHDERRRRRQRVAKFCRDHTVEDAAVEFGLSAGTVRAACTEHGVVPAKADVTNGPSRNRLELVADLLYTNTAYSTLARQQGVTRQAVEKFASKCLAAGLKVRQR